MSGYASFARYYDALTSNVGYAERAVYFDRILREAGVDGGLLLDLACGTGRLSVELARLGWEVIGVDGSGEMLAQAQPRAMEAGQNILFLCQDMEELDLYGTIDGCVCALDSLNHLPDEAALERVIGRVSLFLRPGGAFAFDVNTAYKHREVLGDNCFVYDLPEVYCVWQNRLLPGEDCPVEITLDFFFPCGGGKYGRSSESFAEWVFAPGAVERILDEAGLELLCRYGDDTRKAPAEKTQRIIYVVKKRED